MNYDIAMIDPPWPKKKGGLRAARPNQGRTLDYEVMTIPGIFILMDSEIFSQMNPVSMVFLWSVDEFLHAAEEQMEMRRFRRHARFIWDKTNGIAPAFSVRYSHEYLTWFYRPSFTPVALDMRGKYKTVFTEAAREHSRKPDIAYKMIGDLFPALSKIDVFSREARQGWSQWGNQTDHFLEGQGLTPAHP